MDLERRADSTFRKENLPRCHDSDDDSDDTYLLKMVMTSKEYLTNCHQFCELGENAGQPYHHR